MSINKTDQLPSLLLLPFPPQPFNRTLLNAAYRPSLTTVLSTLKNANPHGASKLIIAVAVPILQGPPYQLRSKTLDWSQAQSLVAGLYAIISVNCARLGISTEIDGGVGSVDATVVLVDHDRGRKPPLTAEDKSLRGDFNRSGSLIETSNTVVVDLWSFTETYHPWNYIFHVRTEQGIKLNEDYLKMAERKMLGSNAIRQEQLVGVEGGLTLNSGLAAPAEGGVREGGQREGRRVVSGVSTVCLGGTFDYLHPGHKLLLTAGALLLGPPSKDEMSLPATSPRHREPCRYIIGITGDELLKNKKFAEYVQSWETRARNVIYFLSRLLQLSERGWREATGPAAGENNINTAVAAGGWHIDETGDGDFRAAFRDGTIIIQCVKIQDAFGPTITVEDIDVLVVSGETREGGKAVNDKRAEQGWKTIEVFEVDVLNADEIPDDVAEDVKSTENFASKISSTVIRQQRAAQATGRSEPKI